MYPWNIVSAVWWANRAQAWNENRFNVRTNFINRKIAEYQAKGYEIV